MRFYFLMMLFLSLWPHCSVADAGYGHKMYMNGDYEKAINIYCRGAVEGNIVAKYMLAQMLLKGEGVPANASEAFKRFRNVVEDGYGIYSSEAPDFDEAALRAVVSAERLLKDVDAEETEESQSGLSNNSICSPSVSSSAEILRLVNRAYRNLHIYKDSGKAKIVYSYRDGRKQVKEKQFEMEFVRPDKFRFSFFDSYENKNTKKNEILIDEDKVVAHWGFSDKAEIYETGQAAICSAAGISDGLVLIMPGMLRKEFMCSERTTNLVGDVLIWSTDELLMLHGVDLYGRKIDIWIDSGNYHIRKVRVRASSESLDMDMIVRYDIWEADT